MTDTDDSTGPAEGPRAAAAIPARCMQRGCERSDVEQCAFSDRHERRCPTRWCPEHAAPSPGGTYCRRHAGVAQALRSQSIPSSIPELDNRAPSLVHFVARALDPGVRALLEPRAAAGESVAVEAVHVARGPRSRRWEHAWALRTGAGHDRVRVAVEVDDHRDPELGLRVDQEVVSRSIPPWIGHRLRNEQIPDEQDAAEREDFYAALLDLIRESLELLDQGGPAQL
ncbi:MAG: hypothetical protein NVSMB29_04020 [Candidatus Dormibacteria bacterium]